MCSSDLDDHKILFSESNTRFLVEIKDEDRFISIMRGLPIKNLGRITKNRSFKICNPIGKVIVNTDIDALKSAWQSTLNGL